jgi:hypothetical protein
MNGSFASGTLTREINRDGKNLKKGNYLQKEFIRVYFPYDKNYIP